MLRGLRIAAWGTGAALLGLIVTALLFRASLRAPAPRAAPHHGVVLEGVTLVEPGGERRGPVRVMVEVDRIARVEAAAAADASGGDTDSPRDPTRDSGSYSGHYVLPALTDMHAHFPPTGFPGDEAYTALLFLRYGVTRVRLAGGTPPEVAAEWRERVAEGAWPGPWFQSCGPILDGDPPRIPGSVVVPDAESARAAVERLADAGVDCIKAYDGLDRESAVALAEAARARGLPIIGHTPQALPFGDPVLDDVQHLRGVHPPFAGEDLRHPYFLAAWERLDDAWLQRVVSLSREKRIAHTPTLVAIEGNVVARDWQRWRSTSTMQAWPPHLRDGLWSAEVGLNPVRFAPAEALDSVARATRQMARTVRALHEAGVAIHTGTDANVPNVVPGASLHRELALLVEAGLAPEEALRASTRTSPRFLGVRDAGSLAAGAPADLIVLREDPSQGIAALDSLVAVVAAGRLYTREDLEARLDAYRAHYASPGYRAIVMPLLRGGLRALTGALVVLGLR